MTLTTDFLAWAPLLESCEEYARLSGWRFNLADFLDIDSGRGSAETTDFFYASKLNAMPMVLDWGERVQAARGKRSALIEEFEYCQHLNTSEAVLNSMHAMCRALGFDDDVLHAHNDNSCAYQDVTQPLPVIAKRLLNHRKALDAATDERSRHRSLQASFIVEFGLAHGLPEQLSCTAEGEIDLIYQ